MHEEYKDTNLQAYCHYPIAWAEQEHRDSQKDMYRIVTINWTVAINENLGTVDYEHVHKNVYEMTLSEFHEWWCGMDEGDEIVVSVEKIKNNGGWVGGIDESGCIEPYSWLMGVLLGKVNHKKNQSQVLFTALFICSLCFFITAMIKVDMRIASIDVNNTFQYIVTTPFVLVISRT
jgi:hypothetical protein